VNRRAFITLLGGTAVAWPRAALAQQAAMPVVGLLGGGSPSDVVAIVAAFRQGLQETGYVEGQNVDLEYRWAEGQSHRLPALAAELVRRRVNVIATAGGTPATVAAKAATTTIPIVFVTTSDPVDAGFVTSLNRPGGNLTGMALLILEIGPKRLELLHELLPRATTVALLVNPTSPILAETELKNVQTAAHALGLQIRVLHASTDRELDAAFANLVQRPADAMMIGPDPFFTGRSKQLAELALRSAVPAIYWTHGFAAAGGLMSYGGSLTDGFRQAGVYTGRILKGEKPADLPVQQSTKVELIINLKTAKALGIAVPISLLGRADEIIE
jgi:putative tryptophan/tyrosine transport system substrate-binding protein